MNKQNIHFPAEWEEQSAVQLTWPHENTDWNENLSEVIKCYIEIAKHITEKQILLVVTENIPDVKKYLKSCNQSNIRYYNSKIDDTWARDHGGISVYKNNAPFLYDFCFNGWGNKFNAKNDNKITKHLFSYGAFNNGVTYQDHLNYVLEGGSVESDGNGTILTTVECLTEKNRNPHWTKKEIEANLKQWFGVQNILWLSSGYLAGDDTDSHIDTLARFCSSDTICYVQCTDKDDEHYAALKQMEDELKGFKNKVGESYQLIPLPMADVVRDNEGNRMPATYANFLIMNGKVLVPTYNSPKDAVVLEIFKKIFTDREIVGIDCLSLVQQHGSLHCITMQYPKGFVI